MNTNTEPQENNWKVGELAPMRWRMTQLKKGGSTSYAFFIRSGYICIREATETQPGILVKALGKVPRSKVMILGGEPFCKDDRDDLFKGKRYYSYSFPAADELKEALDILRNNPSLLKRFDEESMHLNPSSTFWVWETAGHLPLLKSPQYYDASTGKLNKATDDTPHYRLTMVYYDKEENSDVSD